MIYNKTCQDWVDFEKSVGSLRKDLDREALEGILGSLRWHKNLWFNLLTSSTLLYVRRTFLHNQTRWSHVFCTCVVPHHGNCKGIWIDLFNGTHLLVWSPRVLYLCFLYEVIRRMTCSIQDEHVLGCDVATFCHTCAFCMSNMRGKDTLHSNRGCSRLNAVHVAAWRMDTVSIVNGNVCGCFRDVVARKVRFLQVN
jgi:hypothetical protein